MQHNVLITASIHPYLADKLTALGHNVDIKEDIERNELLQIIAKYSVLIITTYTKVDKELIDQATQLQIVGRVGSGMENVDVSYCLTKKIVCLSSPEGNGNAVGEHCLAMLLNLLNNINKAANELKNNRFLREENRGVELDGKTIGIIGYGHTGSAFAKKLKGFDTTILVYDRYHQVADDLVKHVSLCELQQYSDVISFHVPYNESTHYYLNKDFIAQCRRRPIFINTSRGAIANTVDLLDALKNNNTKGVCLDVFEDEPTTKACIHENDIYQKLFSFNNVIATPHIAGWTVESKYKLSKILMDKLELIL